MTPNERNSMKPMIRYRRDLWRLLADFPVKAAAEIGVAEGYFSAEMLAWPIQLERVYMVDRWCKAEVAGDSSNPQEWHDKNKEAAIARVAPYGERAVVLQGNSVEMAIRVADKSLSLVYIDADHSYEGVMADAVAWFPKLVDGGVMAFHDFEAPHYGVKRAVQEFSKAWNLTLHLLPEDKPEDAGAYFYADTL